MESIMTFMNFTILYNGNEVNNQSWILIILLFLKNRLNISGNIWIQVSIISQNY